MTLSSQLVSPVRAIASCRVLTYNILGDGPRLSYSRCVAQLATLRFDSRMRHHGLTMLSVSHCKCT
jgi:hypothetical protein